MSRYHLMWLVRAGLVISLVFAAPACSYAQQKARQNPAAEIPEKGVGSKSAPILMEVWSDFQCPACRDLYRFTLRQVIDTYVATGKVYLLHRDMPLAMHKHARDAARFANAAGLIGRFEKVAEALYATQDAWSANGNVELVVSQVLTPVEMKKVRDFIAAGKVEAAIDKDVALGQRNQVRQTPSVFITHRGQMTPLPPGGVSFPLLKQYFDHLLKQ